MTQDLTRTPLLLTCKLVDK